MWAVQPHIGTAGNRFGRGAVRAVLCWSRVEGGLWEVLIEPERCPGQENTGTWRQARGDGPSVGRYADRWGKWPALVEVLSTTAHELAGLPLWCARGVEYNSMSYRTIVLQTSAKG